MLEQPLKCTADSLKAISHPLRLKILCALGEKEMYVSELATYVGTSQSNLSHHLATMREYGVLKSRRESKNIIYQIHDKRTIEMIDVMRQLFCMSPS